MYSSVWKDQALASGVSGFNVWKQQNLDKQIDEIVNEKMLSLKQQDIHFENAIGHMAKMRMFLSNPMNILGSDLTKHGEIAEHMEVNVRNAWLAIKGQDEVATFVGVGRTAPEDYYLNDIKYQSKFTNGTNSTLKNILEHHNRYQDGSTRYMIPKDQYEIIQAIRSGKEPSHLNNKSIRAILQKIEEIEYQTGHSFDNIIESSVSGYDEVQLGKAGEIVLKHKDRLVDENQKIHDDIYQKAENRAKTMEAKRAPSLGEGAKVTGAAAAIAASLNTVTVIYSKVKSGKKIQDFDKEDWKEIGLSSIKAGAKSGVTAASVYALTNLTSLAAPFAGAISSASMGLASLMADVKSDQITMDEFLTQGQILCLEAGIAATGGAIGQMLIPIPVLGSIIGTVTANLVWGFAKDKLGARETELKSVLDNYTNSLLEGVEQSYLEIITKINETYARYQSLLEAAFDVQVNTAVLAAASIDLAFEIGVEESKILKSDDELEAFLIG